MDKSRVELTYSADNSSILMVTTVVSSMSSRRTIHQSRLHSTAADIIKPDRASALTKPSRANTSSIYTSEMWKQQTQVLKFVDALEII